MTYKQINHIPNQVMLDMLFGCKEWHVSVPTDEQGKNQLVTLIAAALPLTMKANATEDSEGMKCYTREEAVYEAYNIAMDALAVVYCSAYQKDRNALEANHSDLTDKESEEGL